MHWEHYVLGASTTYWNGLLIQGTNPVRVLMRTGEQRTGVRPPATRATCLPARPPARGKHLCRECLDKREQQLRSKVTNSPSVSSAHGGPCLTTLSNSSSFFFFCLFLVELPFPLAASLERQPASAQAVCVCAGFLLS